MRCSSGRSRKLDGLKMLEEGICGPGVRVEIVSNAPGVVKEEEALVEVWEPFEVRKGGGEGGARWRLGAEEGSGELRFDSSEGGGLLRVGEELDRSARGRGIRTEYIRA